MNREDKKILKKIKKVKKNGLRIISDKIRKKMGISKNIILGSYYYYLHGFLLILLCYILFFNNNLAHLSAVLVIISMDAVANVVLHDCPLTILEHKYLEMSGADEKNEMLQNLGINYNCNHTYEKVIELLINGWMMCVLKTLYIIIFRMTNIKIINYNNIMS